MLKSVGEGTDETDAVDNVVQDVVVDSVDLTATAGFEVALDQCLVTLGDVDAVEVGSSAGACGLNEASVLVAFEFGCGVSTTTTTGPVLVGMMVVTVVGAVMEPVPA